jgi:hypothetical protein
MREKEKNPEIRWKIKDKQRNSTKKTERKRIKKSKNEQINVHLFSVCHLKYLFFPPKIKCRNFSFGKTESVWVSKAKEMNLKYLWKIFWNWLANIHEYFLIDSKIMRTKFDSFFTMNKKVFIWRATYCFLEVLKLNSNFCFWLFSFFEKLPTEYCLSYFSLKHTWVWPKT